MAIRDRGIKKFQGAFFMPEHLKMLKGFRQEYYRQPKPILDYYETEEIEEKIHEAMEFTQVVKITTWEDGFEWDYKGMLHRLDGLTKMIYLEKEDGYIVKIKFDDIVRVNITSK